MTQVSFRSCHKRSCFLTASTWSSFYIHTIYEDCSTKFSRKVSQRNWQASFTIIKHIVTYRVLKWFHMSIIRVKLEMCLLEGLRYVMCDSKDRQVLNYAQAGRNTWILPAHLEKETAHRDITPNKQSKYFPSCKLECSCTEKENISPVVHHQIQLSKVKQFVFPQLLIARFLYY